MIRTIFAVVLTVMALGIPQAKAMGFADTAYVRINQMGYLPGDAKVAVAFSKSPVRGEFTVVREDNGQAVHRGAIAASPAPGWGTFPNYYHLDFSTLNAPGRYYIRVESTGERSQPFTIGGNAFEDYASDLLGFMRQQRCGYNPFLDMVCHRRDGRTFEGPLPDSTYIDVSGGWHDAGDQLKYLITSSNATARMLLAYELYPDRFDDKVDDLGHPRANGIPDVLDEAKWGLDWLHKLHPTSDQLYHQVADDRDHRGWKWPDQDPSDYGWGPNSYRVVYFATGEPQGAGRYFSQATGIANLAGRYAAAMAIAHRIWKDVLKDEAFAEKCLRAAQEVYALGKAKEGFQQGNSFGAPFRYTEDTWADDMEWGAAELYRVTGDEAYLTDAKRYATIIGTTSWMGRDTTDHYQMYPFTNVGHYALHQATNEASLKNTLAAYYRDGIEKSIARGSRNAYQIGVPFIWCSNNLAVNLITQILLYEKMTGDMRYHDFMVAQHDWLWGRNPWGTSMFHGMPEGGEWPLDVHTSVYQKTQQVVPGGLVDGPVYMTIYNAMIERGLALTGPDEFARFQNRYVTYHDDIGDFVTNEPTMDGTADAIFVGAHFGPRVR